ncbi:protein BRANCHLESS TRICHOME-like [Dioscorea cayenensis subsp. rotundata]|uniref:Protein BRANCHLESS TRICHOME-like n=1 Tax=Dioscorea cayennensis subsp. rotundata TaxID=55577 RepID=A0AB40B315_DIOCR|nr:protein BRANCHLESS TRICHOME-like [Dioscorea cayenensis subsp. rotundata]
MGPLHSSLSSPAKTTIQASESQKKPQKRKRNKSRGPVPPPPPPPPMPMAMAMAMKEKMMLTLPLEPPLPSWKLYDNPHYSHSYSPSTNPHESPTHPSITPMACGEDSPPHLLQLAHARIEELQVELEFERRMRKRVESLNGALARDLAEERKAREEAECLRAKLQQEVNKKVEELEEERRMLRVAEVWREERVQMKLNEAKIIMEEKLQKLGGGGRGSVSKTLEPAAPGTPTAVAIDGVGHQRREVENPHIKRGIKGFVEFPKVMKGKASNGTISAGKDGKSGHVGFNLECQKAQLRILMRQTKNPVGISIVGSTDHLVM